MSDARAIQAADEGQAVLGTAVFMAEAADVTEFSALLRRLGNDDSKVMPGGCAAAIPWCSHQRASVVIVDIDREPAPLATIADLATHCEPTCSIIALGSHTDIDLYRALLHGGVLDYLKKPVRLDLLATALERARNGVSSDSARLGRSIAVTACAGGLGASCVTAGLALLLSTDRHIPVAVVDFDRRKGEQGLLLGVDPAAGLEVALATRPIDPHLLERAMVRVNPRLKLLAQEPTWTDLAADSDHLLTLGANLCQLLNQVIWDLPAGWPNGSLEVLRHAEIRVLLIELTLQSARTARQMLEKIGDESDGQRLLLVHNPSHGANGSIPQAQFEEYVGRKIDFALPYAGNTLRDGLLHGPLDLERSPALRQGLLDLADLICGLKPRHAAHRGLLGRLRQAIGRRAA